jgi:hypothetical protein
MSSFKKLIESGKQVKDQALDLKFKSGITTFTVAPESGNVVLVSFDDKNPLSRAEAFAIPFADFEAIVGHFNRHHNDGAKTMAAEAPAQSLSRQCLDAQRQASGCDKGAL